MYGKIITVSVKPVEKLTVAVVDGKEYIIGEIISHNMNSVVLRVYKSSWQSDEQIPRNITMASSRLSTLIVVDREDVNNKYPLKRSQWMAAISNGEVNAGKYVKYELKDDNPVLAKIIPPKRVVYQEEALKDAFNAAREKETKVRFLSSKYKYNTFEEYLQTLDD